MREGRRRPSLVAARNRIDSARWAAMREGRRRPSLESGSAGAPTPQTCRNEGGAPAPLVVGWRESPRPLGSGAAMREGRRRPSLDGFRNDIRNGMSAAMREGRRRPSLLPVRPE